MRRNVLALESGDQIFRYVKIDMNLLQRQRQCQYLFFVILKFEVVCSVLTLPTKAWTKGP